MIMEYEEERLKLCADAENEVQRMDDLKGCPNVIYYEDFRFRDWEENNSFGCDLLIKMPLMESVIDLIKKGEHFSNEQIIRIGKDISSALIYCHRNNILHRDIKAENIFRNKQGIYFLGDFGISRILSRAQMASTGIGTFQYAAPEQAQLEKYDHRADIYSLGLTLYVLGNRNRLPFTNKYNIPRDSPEIIKRIKAKELPPPSDCDPGLSHARTMLRTDTNPQKNFILL